MEWVYNGQKYKTVPIGHINYSNQYDYMYVYEKLSSLIGTTDVIYHTKANKCYYVEYVSFSGNGNHLKVQCIDIYNNKLHWFSASNLEFVEILN